MRPQDTKTGSRTYQGGCHCGAVTVVLAWPEARGITAARCCGCDYCGLQAPVWTSHPDARLSVTAAPDALTAYRFGTRTADFMHCRQCGVLLAAICVLEGRQYAVVNLRIFPALDITALATESMDYDGEETGDRLRRRQRYWIGQVQGIGH